MVVDKARTTKVNNLNLASGVGLDEDVFRLQVAVDELKVMDEAEGVKDLLSDALQTAHVEVYLLLSLSVILRVLIQVVSQQLSHNEEMFFVVEVVDKLKEVLFVEVLAVCVDVAEQFNLINTLVEIVLVVLDNLHAHHLLCVDVVTLNRL